MSSSKQESPTGETKLSTLKRGTSLNPNAAEFIPFSYRGASTTTSISDVAAKFPASGSSGNHVLDRSKSSVSTNSDEEAQQFWQCQLPDDITPDFKVMGEESLEVDNLSFSGLSLHDSNEANRFSTSVGTGYLFNEQLDASSHHTNGGAVLDKMRYSNSSIGVDLSSPSYLHKAGKPWEMQVLGDDNHFENERVGSSIDESLRFSCPNDIGGQSSMFENNTMNAVDFLASQFPGFAAESLAEVYFASGCDLNLTIEMLTQLEVCLILQELSLIHI